MANRKKNIFLKPSLRYLQTFFDVFVCDNETFGIEPRQLTVRQVGFVQNPFTRHLALTVGLIRESALCKIYEWITDICGDNFLKKQRIKQYKGSNCTFPKNTGVF